MEMKQIIFSLYQKGSKEGIGILTFRLLFPLKASGCFSPLLCSSNILTYRFSLNEQKSVFTVRNLLWCQLLPHIKDQLSSPYCPKWAPPFLVTSVMRATRMASLFFLVFWPYFTHIKHFPCAWSSPANWQGFGGSVPMSATVCSGISGEN